MGHMFSAIQASKATSRKRGVESHDYKRKVSGSKRLLLNIILIADVYPTSPPRCDEITSKS